MAAGREGKLAEWQPRWAEAGFCTSTLKPTHPDEPPADAEEPAAGSESVEENWKRMAGCGGRQGTVGEQGTTLLGYKGFRKLADRPHPLAGDMNRQPCLARLPQ